MVVIPLQRTLIYYIYLTCKQDLTQVIQLKFSDSNHTKLNHVIDRLCMLLTDTRKNQDAQLRTKSCIMHFTSCIRTQIHAQLHSCVTCMHSNQTACMHACRQSNALLSCGSALRVQLKNKMAAICFQKMST